MPPVVVEGRTSKELKLEKEKKGGTKRIKNQIIKVKVRGSIHNSHRIRRICVYKLPLVGKWKTFS